MTDFGLIFHHCGLELILPVTLHFQVAAVLRKIPQGKAKISANPQELSTFYSDDKSRPNCG